MKRAWLAVEIVFLSLAASAAAAQEPLSGFLCCNMHSDGEAISDINIDEAEQHVIPVGTPIRTTGYGKHRVKVVVENKNQAITNDYSRDLPIQDFAKRYIIAENPADKIKSYPKNIQYAIAQGHLVKGMTRDQVIMSLGYPISSENPNLNSAAWTYWITDKVQYRIKFDGQARVFDVENTVDAKSKLFSEQPATSEERSAAREPAPMAPAAPEPSPAAGNNSSTAVISDSVHVYSARKADFFFIDSIDGRHVENALEHTERANYGKGIAMNPEGKARPVQPKATVFHIAGRTHFAAPLLQMAGTSYLVDGDVTFTPVEGQSYIVKGSLGPDYSAVWIENRTSGAQMGNKLVINGSADVGLVKKRPPVEQIPPPKG
jgi:hypothetical protein